MAYVAVSSLLQTLEYLLQFPCTILQVKKMQAIVFCNEVHRVLRLLNRIPNFPGSRREQLREELDFIAPSIISVPRTAFFRLDLVESRLKKLQKEIEHLALPITEHVKVVKDEGRVEVVLEILEIKKEYIFGIYHGNENAENMLEILEEASQISKRIDNVAAGLRRFLETTELKSCWGLVLDILLDSHSLMQDITFFHEMVTQTIVLCLNLLNLLTFLEDSSNKFHDLQVVSCIRNVAEGAGNFVEEYMMDNPIDIEFNYYLDMVTNITTYSSGREINLEKAVKDFFNGDKGIRQCLLHTVEEIHSLKGEITKKYDKTSGLQVASTSVLIKGSSLLNSKQDIVIGLDDQLIRIMEGLTGLPSGVEIVTIVGMGGIGKTTLARKIFHHPFIGYHFHCRAWIVVSQVYHVRDLLLGILGYVAQPSDEMFKKSSAQLAEQLYRNLKDKRYLIVVDDMWSIDAWNDIKRCFPDDKVGSRIIITSRFTELAIHANPRNPPHCMNLLDLGQSWELLGKLVFGQEVCPPELVNIGKQIARKCKGLPLAIVVIAGLLSQSVRTHEYWKEIADSVISNVCNDPEQCLDILALSYNRLPLKLKACFLYMGAFPEDSEIEVPKMIQIWIAEGFIEPKSSRNLEEKAEHFLECLIDRSLVMVGKKSFSGRTRTCRLHDLLRELCLREAQKENFIHVLQREEQYFPTDANNQRRLSFHLNSDGDVHLAPPYPHLRSFLCFTLGSDFVADIFFSCLHFKLLRVLDMFFLPFDSFPSQILELANLRYLALNVTYELPRSISKLLKLQTLIIHGPWNCWNGEEVPTLSLEYWSMRHLRHLYIKVASCLANPSPKMDLCLSMKEIRPQVARDLQTLSTVSFSSCKCAILCVMPHLKKLGICETKEDYIADSSANCLNNLVCLPELETIKCSFYLERTKREHKILHWNVIPSGVKKLTLSQSYLSWKNMTFVAKLPNLEVLKLKSYAFQGPEWEPAEGEFRCLKHLLIEETDLVVWDATSNNFPCLQQLVLKSCKLLLEVPYGIGAISALERIELHHCSRSAEVSVKEIQEQIQDLDVVIKSDW